MVEYSFTNEVVLDSSSVVVISTLDMMPVLAEMFLDIQATLECRFTLKRGCDMIRTYSQMHRTDKDSQNSSTIWPECFGQIFQCSFMD